MVLLAKAMTEKGHRVSVVALHADGAFAHDLASNDIDVVDLGKAHRYDIYGPLKRLNAYLREKRPDVLYSFLGLSNVAAALADTQSIKSALVWGVRISAHPRFSYGLANAVVEGLENCLIRRPDRIIANSNAGREWLIDRGASADKCTVIFNGFDPDQFRIDAVGRTRQRSRWAVGDTDKIVGIVARRDPMKDFPNFFAAARHLCQLFPEIRFSIVTDEEKGTRESLSQMAQNFGVADRVLWSVDSHDNLNDVYNAIDVMCLSSAFGEGFPNVLAEAMLCGKTCVCTNVGDARDIVGDLGRVVPVSDSVALAEQLGHALREGTTAQMAAACRARIVENFSLDACVAATETILADAAQTALNRQDGKGEMPPVIDKPVNSIGTGSR